jgi:hypothetical protein
MVRGRRWTVVRHRAVIAGIAAGAILGGAALAQERPASRSGALPDEQTYTFGADPGATSSFSGNWFFGGYVGLSYGAVEYVEVAPFGGYRFSENFGAGLGLLYRYRKDTRGSNDYTASDYGGNLFARYYLFQGVFTQAEYDYTKYEYPTDPSSGATGRSSHESFLLGGGYNTAISHGLGFYLAALYDFNYDSGDPYRLYNSPLQLRVGVSVGF